MENLSLEQAINIVQAAIASIEKASWDQRVLYIQAVNTLVNAAIVNNQPAAPSKKK